MKANLKLKYNKKSKKNQMRIRMQKMIWIQVKFHKKIYKLQDQQEQQKIQELNNDQNEEQTHKQHHEDNEKNDHSHQINNNTHIFNKNMQLKMIFRLWESEIGEKQQHFNLEQCQEQCFLYVARNLKNSLS